MQDNYYRELEQQIEEQRARKERERRERMDEELRAEERVQQEREEDRHSAFTTFSRKGKLLKITPVSSQRKIVRLNSHREKRENRGDLLSVVGEEEETLRHNPFKEQILQPLQAYFETLNVVSTEQRKLLDNYIYNINSLSQKQNEMLSDINKLYEQKIKLAGGQHKFHSLPTFEKTERESPFFVKEEVQAPDLPQRSFSSNQPVSVLVPAKNEAAVNTTKSLAERQQEERLSRIKPMSEEERKNYVNPYDELPVGSSINKSMFVDNQGSVAFQIDFPTKASNEPSKPSLPRNQRPALSRKSTFIRSHSVQGGKDADLIFKNVPHSAIPSVPQMSRLQSSSPSKPMTAQPSEQDSREEQIIVYDGQLRFNSSNQVTVQNSIVEKFEEESILVGRNEKISANTSIASYRAREEEIRKETQKSVRFGPAETPNSLITQVKVDTSQMLPRVHRQDDSLKGGRSFTSAQQYAFMTQDLEDAFNIAYEPIEPQSYAMEESKSQALIKQIVKSKTEQPVQEEKRSSSRNVERLFSIRKKKVPSILRPRGNSSSSKSEIDRLLDRYSQGSRLNESSEIREMMGGKSKHKTLSKILRHYSSTHDISQ